MKVQLSKISMILGFFVVIYWLSPQEIVIRTLSNCEFISIFLMAAVIGTSKALIMSCIEIHKYFGCASLILNGILLGAVAGYGVLSLFVLYSWQWNPEIDHLEPLFTTLGLALIATESSRRLTMEQLKGSSND